jgi:hypothetical protein
MTCYRSGWGWYGSSSWRTGQPDPDIRVSDAERAQMADVLANHFADGRLDQSEFDERMGKAMAAKHRRDLAGLLADLPPLPAPAPSAPELRRRRGRLGLFLLAVLLFVVAANVPVWPAHFPWLLLAIVVFVAWWASSRRTRWRRRDEVRHRT